MKGKKKYGSMTRREFNKSLMTVAVGAPLFISGDLVSKASTKPDKLDRRNERSSMTYRKLGRTNFMSSRLVFGCGAALAGGKAVRLLDRAFEVGINHYDVGSDIYYKGSERSLSPFLKANRGNIWVTSKAPLPPYNIKPEDQVTLEQTKAAANSWTKLLNQSLKDLQTEYVDAYYLMAINNPAIICSEEIYKAFLDAKTTGKVGYFGLSTHKNAKKVLEAAIKTGWYDLAMIGITPAGWYDWTTKEIEKDTPSLMALQPLLKQARDAGIGLIGMKAVRLMAPMQVAGKGDVSAFDKFYDKKLLVSPLTPFQRAYAYVLENGLDVVNADMQNFTHLEENIVAATSHTYFG
ncbi:MAG: aldo/keto reductase [Bacteroidetes bacterium]|nr:aldo/keto reductase [Bacteroidota bacterium]